MSMHHEHDATVLESNIRQQSSLDNSNLAYSNQLSITHEMSMHPMSFHFGSMETILFNFWAIKSPLGIIVSCFVIILSCFALECVRWLRVYCKKQQFTNENDSLNETINSRPNLVSIVSKGGLHAIQLTLSYMLMLVFMTFNVWLCAAVIFGEVLARTLVTLYFPDLERFSNTLSLTETCCG